MLIGIGLPAPIPGVNDKLILDWARRADAGTFSSLGIIDRLVYSNLEPLITLAVVAGVTQRIRLITTLLAAPFANAGVPATHLSPLDHPSCGRLALSRRV